jgi:hypothetical protein
VKDKVPRDEGPLGPDDAALLRLLRAARRRHGVAGDPIDEAALTAYVMGTASPAESATVQAAMLRNPEFGRQVLDLMQAAERTSSPEERRAFEQAAPPSLEQTTQLAALAAALGPATAAPARKINLGASSRRGWIEWALGGWAVTATAAACALFVVMSRTTPTGTHSQPGETPGTSTPGGSTSTGQRSPQPPFAIEVLETIKLRSPSRGSGSETPPTISVGPSIRVIHLSADPPYVPKGSRVRVTLTGPDGKLLLDETHPVEDFFGSRTLALQSQHVFQPGPYELTIAGKADGTAAVVQYPFVIRVNAQ